MVVLTATVIWTPGVISAPLALAARTMSAAGFDGLMWGVALAVWGFVLGAPLWRIIQETNQRDVPATGKRPSLQDFGLSQSQIFRYGAKEIPRTDWLSSLIYVAWTAGAVWLFFVLLNDGDGIASSLSGATFFWFMGWLAFVLPARGLPTYRYERGYRDYLRFKEAVQEFDARKEKVAKEAAEQEQRRHRQFWMSLSGRDFEKELAQVFRAHGVDVELTPESGDQGIDLVLKVGDRTTVVQCKRTKHPVGPAVARELYGALVHRDADDALLACTAGVTSGVEEFIRGKPIKVLDLDDIVSLSRKVAGSDNVQRPQSPDPT